MSLFQGQAIAQSEIPPEAKPSEKINGDYDSVKPTALPEHKPTATSEAVKAPSQERTGFAKDVDFEDATPEQMKEAKRFYKSCSKNESLRKKHDCNCLATEFLGARMKLGASLKAGEIYQNISGECPVGVQKVTEEDPLADQDYSEEQLKEANGVYEECKGNFNMRTYHNCKCMAATFLQERVKQGRLVARDVVLTSLRSKCLNGTDTAGLAYNECMGNPIMVPGNISEPKKFCECYANEFGKTYQNFKGNMSGSASQDIAITAMGECQIKLMGMR